PWLILLLLGCLLPAVGEEIFFRGFLGRALVARYGTTFGVGFTSILFGLVHIDPISIGVITILGLVLHVVYLCTKTLLAPILLHLLYNLAVLALRKLWLEETLVPANNDGTMLIPMPLWWMAVGLIVILIVVLILTRTRWITAEGEEWSPGYVSAEMPPV